MSSGTSDGAGLKHFRRSLTFLRPQRRLVIMGLLCAVGVSLSYTASISALIPVLKIMFAEHETVADWLNRTETERRLGIVIGSDLPDDPAGIMIDRLQHSATASKLRPGQRIAALDGQPAGSHELMSRLASATGDTARVALRNPDGTTYETELPLQPYRSWWQKLHKLAALLPADRDPRGRLITLALVMAALVASSIFGGLCRFANEGLIQTAVQRAMHAFRTRVGDHVLRLPMQWHALQAAGDTLARLATDISKVEVGQSTLFGKVIREPLKAVCVLALTLFIEWRLLVAAMFGLPVGWLLLRTFGRLVKRAQRGASQSWGRLLDHLGERLAGIRIVKACNMQQAECRRFEREGAILTRAQTHIELVDAATNPALEILATTAIAGFILYGGYRVFQQQLEPSLFFAAVICLGGVFDPIRKMGNVTNRLQAADASARRLFELLDLPAEEQNGTAHDGPPATRADLPPFRETIEFRNLCFAYAANARPVLQDINLTISKGECVALVGPNGSGKTTLVSLLMRFFEPTSGQIFIDGRDIADFTLHSLRRQIGLVTQDAVIFTGTLRENLSYGATNVSEDRLQAAARLAHVDEFARNLRIEDNGRITTGYDAHISARTLSGGQRQRIALARAVLPDPPILILDEATSQVDSESERRIQQALDDVTRGRTTFIIAHRFSTIARANRIVVLNEGRIIGCGTHDDLLQSCPFYVSLCQTQFAHGFEPATVGASAAEPA
jgi:subfamily B ATP-binding cassette protein MsbA